MLFLALLDLKPVAKPREFGRKAQSKKNMLSSQPIGCHGSPQANFR